jgi:hypothetical protein
LKALNLLAYLFPSAGQGLNVHRLIPLYFAKKLPTIVAMNIELRFGANKGGQQPSEISHLANRENALLVHTLDPQIFEEPPHEMGGNSANSNRFWPKNRSCRKQTSKPCLTGARIAVRASATCNSAQAYLVLSDSFSTHQIQAEEAAQIQPVEPVTNRDKISALPRTAAKNLCGTLEVWGNSEVA